MRSIMRSSSHPICTRTRPIIRRAMVLALRDDFPNQPLFQEHVHDLGNILFDIMAFGVVVRAHVVAELRQRLARAVAKQIRRRLIDDVDLLARGIVHQRLYADLTHFDSVDCLIHSLLRYDVALWVGRTVFEADHGRKARGDFEQRMDVVRPDDFRPVVKRFFHQQFPPPPIPPRLPMQAAALAKSAARSKVATRTGRAYCIAGESFRERGCSDCSCWRLHPKVQEDMPDLMPCALPRYKPMCLPCARAARTS